MGIEVVSRDDRWFVRKDDGSERQFPDRETAVQAAKALTTTDVPVVHERSAHIKADLKFK